MSADTSMGHTQGPAARRTARPTIPHAGRYAGKKLPGRTDQHAATPGGRVSESRVAAPRQVAGAPAAKEPVRPGTNPDLDPGPWPGASDRDALELPASAGPVRPRDRYGRLSGGSWAIVFDRFWRRWIAVGCQAGWECSGTPAALERLIDRA